MISYLKIHVMNGFINEFKKNFEDFISSLFTFFFLFAITSKKQKNIKHKTKKTKTKKQKNKKTKQD